MLSALLRSTIENPTPFTGRRWYAVLVLAVALSLTAAATAALSSAIRRTDAGRFDAALDGVRQ